MCYLGKVPRDTIMPLFGLFDHKLQPTVGERVALVELQIPLVGKEATASLWRDVPDPFCGHNCGGEI